MSAVKGPVATVPQLAGFGTMQPWAVSLQGRFPGPLT